MQVPYATRWQKEIKALRTIALGCDLVEEIKWGKPCLTYSGKNIAIIIPLKESCALSFFKGALMKDPAHLLQRVGEHTQSGRWIKFTSVKEITACKASLRSYLYEAVEVEESGKKIARKPLSDFEVPNALQTMLDDNAEVKAAFAALTPGRQKSFILHIAGAKQAATQESRALKCIPTILSGRGFNELPK